MAHKGSVPNRRILIANLAKGAIGGQASNLLGSLLVLHLQLIAMERSAVPPHERVPFFAAVDEFQTFSSDGLRRFFPKLESSSCISASRTNTRISCPMLFARR